MEYITDSYTYIEANHTATVSKLTGGRQAIFTMNFGNVEKHFFTLCFANTVTSPAFISLRLSELMSGVCNRN